VFRVQENEVVGFIPANLRKTCNPTATDITYIAMSHGFIYLTAIIDWYSRMILSWRLSNTMDAHFCRECLQEAFDCFGEPTYFNSD
jgi:putative transposase